MGMTINESISILNGQKDWYELNKSNAIDVATDTMRKYQKIEEIISEWNNHCISTQIAISEIANEVLEDEND